jgi:hypothetical protein
MSKKSLSAGEVGQIINNYLAAVEKRHGLQAKERTCLSYRKGVFFLRSHNVTPGAPAIPFRGHEISAMIQDLLGQAPRTSAGSCSR